MGCCCLCCVISVLLSGCYCQAVTVRLLLSGCPVRLLLSGCCSQAVAVRLYGLHGVSLSALPAFFPCLFTTKVEVVAAWGLCCILQAFHYRPCLSSQWYASSTVVTVTLLQLWLLLPPVSQMWILLCTLCGVSNAHRTRLVLHIPSSS